MRKEAQFYFRNKKKVIPKLTYHCYVAFQRMPIEPVLYHKGCLEKPLVLITGRDNVLLHLIWMIARNPCLSNFNCSLSLSKKKEIAVMVTIPFPKGLKT